MTKTLYQTCPLCEQGAVTEHGSRYRCQACGLSINERSILGVFRKGRYGVAEFGTGDYTLAAPLKQVALTPEPLKIALGNVYTDADLAAIAQGNMDKLRSVQTVLAQIILEQVNEVGYFQVNGLRWGEGPVLEGPNRYQPVDPAPTQGITWQSEGNLFGTTHHLVLPSDNFTFIRLDRKISAVQAFTDGVAIQRRGQDFAMYFVDCYPHEAALVAAFVLGKIPVLRKSLVRP